MKLALLNAFILISAFMVFAAFCSVGDMLVGAWLNKESWDFKKFLSGLKWATILYIFFLWLVGAITVFPLLLAYFNMAAINTELLNGFSALAVAGAFAYLSVDKLYNMGKNLYKILNLKQPDPSDLYEPVIEESEEESAVG
ncbi:MAG TPA: hypothetical protein DCQ90_06395 [Erysipelotrichaceae bacterium]|nr:hypothetical protein [Erysipelotrichaceae bacterium]